MIEVEIGARRGEVILHVDDYGADVLRDAANDAKRPAKVFLGDPGAMLIIRHKDFDGSEDPPGGEG